MNPIVRFFVGEDLSHKIYGAVDLWTAFGLGSGSNLLAVSMKSPVEDESRVPLEVPFEIISGENVSSRMRDFCLDVASKLPEQESFTVDMREYLRTGMEKFRQHAQLQSYTNNFSSEKAIVNLACWRLDEIERNFKEWATRLSFGMDFPKESIPGLHLYAQLEFQKIANL